jgi:DNA repair exonuclease SbcCD ATPase subunit
MTVAAQALVTKGVEDYDKLKIVAKEEEEKRIKALSLLRALRQKLVKSEKDKEEADREKEQLKQAEDKAQEMLKADRTRFDQEIVSMRAAQELQLTKMRQSFERETQSVRAQNEREMAARKGQYELEAITVKAGSAKELAAKEARIQQLEKTVRDVTTSRDVTFEQLQVRTAEMESSAEQQETLEARTGELQYELKEARDRSAALLEEIEELRKVKRDVSRDDSNTRRLLSEAEARHEAKVRDLEARARQLEKDRMETEEEMGRNLQDRLKEVERMRASLAQKDVDYAESVHSSQQREARIEQGETLRRELQAKLRAAEAMLESVREDAEKAAKAEVSSRLVRLLVSCTFFDIIFSRRLLLARSSLIEFRERPFSRLGSRRYKPKSRLFARATRCASVSFFLSRTFI